MQLWGIFLSPILITSPTRCNMFSVALSSVWLAWLLVKCSGIHFIHKRSNKVTVQVDNKDISCPSPIIQYSGIHHHNNNCVSPNRKREWVCPWRKRNANRESNERKKEGVVGGGPCRRKTSRFMCPSVPCPPLSSAGEWAGTLLINLSEVETVIPNYM